MRAINKTIRQEICASPLPEDTRHRLGYLHVGLNIREEDSLRDIETNLRHAEHRLQYISERLEQVKASEEGERFRIADEVRTAISYLATVLEAASEYDAALAMGNDIRDLLDGDGPVPFETKENHGKATVADERPKTAEDMLI